jgi:hypothetical protein
MERLARNLSDIERAVAGLTEEVRLQIRQEMAESERRKRQACRCQNPCRL